MDKAYTLALEKIREAKESGAVRLDLSGMGLKELPGELWELRGLEILLLQENELRNLPKEIGELKQLTQLGLYQNQLTEIPKEIGQLVELQGLWLYQNKLTNILKEIGRLEKLQKLWLHQNQLTNIPKEIGRLEKLQKLGLHQNQLTNIPKEIGQLVGLQELWLYQNQLTNIPKEIGRLEKLQKLWLNQNQLTDIPKEIGQLVGLQELSLHQNQLTNIPKEIGQLVGLQKLWLDQNQLTDIPKEIGQLKQLITLWLSQNQLTDIPEEIGQLTSLKTLVLGENPLREIPKEVLVMNQLEELALHKLNLNSLPIEVTQMVNLRELHLQGNKLSRLPKEIARLTELTTNQVGREWNKGLRLEGNLFDVPEEVFEREPAEIIQYILDWQESLEGAFLHEAKVIVIGQGGVGKTSLVKMLTKGAYDEKELKTEGIEITDWGVKRGEDDIKLHIWDFGGQEIMHATHKFFMTKRTVYVLVTNPRTDDRYGESDVDYWMDLIRSYAGKEVPVVVAVNKCHSHKADIGERSLRGAYPQIVDIVQTDCEDGTGIGDLKELIQEGVGKLKYLDDRLPTTYFEIKEKVTAIEEDYITYFAYMRLCLKTDNQFNEVQMRTLLGLLHDLGLMLNFREEGRDIAQTQVLNPQWVTQGVYALVNAPRLVRQGGKLTLGDVGEILTGGAYPTKKEWGLILGVMKRFELCYEVEGSKEATYLVAGALPKDSPEGLVWKVEGKRALRFRYRYKTMPSSIMSRFIVRMHHCQKKGETVWRNGIVLAKGNCEALVEAFPAQKEIVVTVQGAGHQRSLLVRIREHFDVIHESLEAIGMKEAVHVGMEVEGEWREAWISYKRLEAAERKHRTEIFCEDLEEDVNVQQVLNGVRQKRTRLDSLGRFRGEEIGVLVLSANPERKGAIETEEMGRVICQSLERASYGSRFRIRNLGASRTKDFRYEMVGRAPQLLHFIGEGGEDGLVFHGEDHEGKFVEREAFGGFVELFDEEVECVVLQACGTAEMSRWLGRRIRYVIGVNGRVEGKVAKAFLEAFYEALGGGRGVKRAYEIARGSLGLEGLKQDAFRLFEDGE